MSTPEKGPTHKWLLAGVSVCFADTGLSFDCKLFEGRDLVFTFMFSSAKHTTQFTVFSKDAIDCEIALLI